MEKTTFSQQLPLWSFRFQSSSRIEVVTRKDLEAKLLVKAFREEDFKKALLQNPKSAIAQTFAIELPDKLAIDAVEESDNLLYLLLPHNPYAGIPEEELKHTLGMDFEQIASWVLGQQNGLIADNERSSARIVAKAWRDESFKKLLLADPAFVIEQEVGEIIAAGLTIRVLEESPEKIYLVIPALPDGELSEAEINMKLVNQPVVIGSHHFNTSKQC